MTSIHSENFPRSLSILFHVVAAVPLAGFALFHFHYGSVWLTVLLTASLVNVLLSLGREIRHRDSLGYRQVFVLLVSVTIVYACYQLGLRGLICVFPMASVFFFTFRLSQALVTGVVFSVACLLAVLPSESLLPGTTAEEARRVAEELRQMTAGHAFQDGIRLTCSLGVAELQAGQSVNSWLHAVDTALYEAKRQGRDRVALSTAA